MKGDPEVHNPFWREIGKLRTYLLFCFLFICAIIIAFLFWQIKQHNILTKSQSARKAGKPLPVNVYKVEPGLLDFFIPAECTLKASALIQVNSKNRYSESVKATFVEVNDKVEKGQVLIELDADQEILELQEAQMHLQRLKKEEQDGHKQYFEWSKRNREKGVGLERDFLNSKTDWLHAQTLVGQAEFDAKSKQIRINQKSILAPVSGVVVQIVKAGQATGIDKEGLVSLAVVDPILVVCPISETKLNFIKPGQAISFSVFSYPAQQYQGVIAYINPVADADKRTISVFIKLSNADSKLLPGLHGIARISNSRKALRIPNSALFEGANSSESQVFVVNSENYVHIRPVTTGVYANGFTEIISGLLKGEVIVIAGQFDLREGDKIKIVSETSFSRNE